MHEQLIEGPVTEGKTVLEDGRDVKIF